MEHKRRWLRVVICLHNGMLLLPKSSYKNINMIHLRFINNDKQKFMFWICGRFGVGKCFIYFCVFKIFTSIIGLHSILFFHLINCFIYVIIYVVTFVRYALWLFLCFVNCKWDDTYYDPLVFEYDDIFCYLFAWNIKLMIMNLLFACLNLKFVRNENMFGLMYDKLW